MNHFWLEFVINLGKKTLPCFHSGDNDQIVNDHSCLYVLGII